jgi:hypothetical protein
VLCVCVCACAFFCLCTGRGLATSWSLVQGVLPTIPDQESGEPHPYAPKAGASSQVWEQQGRKKIHLFFYAVFPVQAIVSMTISYCALREILHWFQLTVSLYCRQLYAEPVQSWSHRSHYQLKKHVQRSLIKDFVFLYGLIKNLDLIDSFNCQSLRTGVLLAAFSAGLRRVTMMQGKWLKDEVERIFSLQIVRKKRILVTGWTYVIKRVLQLIEWIYFECIGDTNLFQVNCKVETFMKEWCTFYLYQTEEFKPTEETFEVFSETHCRWG